MPNMRMMTPEPPEEPQPEHTLTGVGASPGVVTGRARVLATLDEAGRLEPGCVLVCDELRLVGVVTERDVLKRVIGAGADLDAPVSQYMTSNPVTIQAGDRVGAVIRRMPEGG